MIKLKNKFFIVNTADCVSQTMYWLLIVLLLAPTMVVANDVKTVDRAGNVGKFTSLSLTPKGNPVVSYHDLTNRDLKLLRCDDPNCDGDESGNTIVPDSTGMVGTYTSLALDSAAKPVISYYDSLKGNLKLHICDSPDCSNGNTRVPDPSSNVGRYTSLKLDKVGNPVVSYYDDGNGSLKLLHCDDRSCAGDETKNITTPDHTGDVGLYSSLALDNTGNPVISYYAAKTGLKLLHCDDPNCKGNESANITNPDKGDVGWFSSLVLDASGNPVVSYYDFSSGDLKVLHCDDPNCAGDESKNITAPDTAGQVGEYISMMLDTSGNPVISYHDATNGDLKILHCDDPNCTGDESANIITADKDGDVGFYTSLGLDTAGNPVVSYYDFSNGDLKLLHCANPTCRGK